MIGLAHGGVGFSENVVAELGGIFIEISLALLLVNHVLERRSDAAWEPADARLRSTLDFQTQMLLAGLLSDVQWMRSMIKERDPEIDPSAPEIRVLLRDAARSIELEASIAGPVLSRSPSLQNKLTATRDTIRWTQALLSIWDAIADDWASSPIANYNELTPKLAARLFLYASSLELTLQSNSEHLPKIIEERLDGAPGLEVDITMDAVTGGLHDLVELIGEKYRSAVELPIPEIYDLD
tara:strand:+ start:2048 stop:2764 length:717 start_codon:yes stop_codon:yes gene_type:complete